MLVDNSVWDTLSAGGGIRGWEWTGIGRDAIVSRAHARCSNITGFGKSFFSASAPEWNRNRRVGGGFT
jgi:hypothetical protein